MAPKSDLSLPYSVLQRQRKLKILLRLASLSILRVVTKVMTRSGASMTGLKKYLQKFGYLNYKNRIHYDADDFDELLEEAVKTHQLNFHLKSTGKLDEKTMSQMMMPRCGVPDIINGTASMRSASKIKSGQHSSIHTTLHFQWKSKMASLEIQSHVRFSPRHPIRSHRYGAIKAAFTTWAKNTHFKFSQAKNHQSADLKVSFHRRDHGDGDPFDGKDGALAHGFAPTDRRLHYDQDENWVVGSKLDTTEYRL